MILSRHIQPTPCADPFAAVAENLMTPRPVSIDHRATIRDAAAFLGGRRISAAPVINDAGRPLGVVSSTDIVRYLSARARRLLRVLQPNERGTPSPAAGEALKALIRGLLADETPVCEIMTPTVFQVRPDTPAREVIETMVSRNVRRLYVVDESGVLVGVISATDILRALGNPRPDEVHESPPGEYSPGEYSLTDRAGAALKRQF